MRAPLPLDDFVCLDFEASALGKGSYPIEAAVVDCATGGCRAWLIQPTPRWLTQGVWSGEAAAVHNIPRDAPLAHGLPAAQVAAELAAACAGKRVLCDGGEHDRHWLFTLFAEAGSGDPPFLIEDYHAFAWDLACRVGRRPDIAIVNSSLEAQIRFPITHRAAADARSLAETLRLIAGWP
jgi:hypothetical protein